MAEAAAQCKNGDCQVAVTGKCAEGHEPIQSCPNFSATEEDGFEDEGPVDGQATKSEQQISLPKGELLNPDEVQRFLLARPAIFVSIIGDSYSGKTTVMCALYDQLLRGTYADVGFAASRTLVALEKRMHPARVESGRTVPDTPRTSISDGLKYFHFAVARSDDPLARSDLFLSDRAGETYRKARSNTALVGDLTEIPQADRIVLFIDGGKVADSAEQAGTLQGSRQLLRVLLDQDAIGKASVVQVVTSKIDVIERAPDKNEIRSSLKSFQDRLSADFGPRVGKLTFWEIAARDPNGAFAPAHGLDALLRDWLQPAEVASSAAKAALPLTSEFDRLLVRAQLGDE
jgi:hypothetical protein